jgi:titin
VIARAGRTVLPLLVLAAAAVVPAAPARADTLSGFSLWLETCGPQPRGTDRAVNLVFTNSSAPAVDVSVTPADGPPPGIVVHDVGPAAPYLGYRRTHEYPATVSVAADAPPGLVSLPFDVTTSAGTVRLAVSYVVSGPVGAPSVTTVTPGDGTAVVKWQPPPPVDGWGVASYVVTAHPGGATTTASHYLTDTTVAGLENGTAYTFTVTARSPSGETSTSPPSDPVTPAGPPLPPEGVAATGSGTSRVVSWEAAADSGSPVTGYTVTTYPGGATTDAAPDARSVEVTGLDPDTTYEFTVRATNAAGIGDESLSTAGGPANGLPGPFTGTMTLSAPPDADGYPVTVTVNLSGLGPDGTVYEIEGLGRQHMAAVGGSASISYPGLPIGTTQAFRVREVNGYALDSGAGPWSPRSAVTPTGAAYIRDVFLVAGDGGVHACPYLFSDRGVPATALIFRAYDATVRWPLTQPAVGTWTLPPDTLDAWLPLANGPLGYVVDVQVVTALGPGSRTQLSALARPKGLPGTAADVAATAGDRSATVTWSAAGWNGSEGLDYEVVASPGGATVWTSGLSAQVDGLVPGTDYTFTVRTLNEVGYGPTTTPTAPMTAIAVPGAPAGVTVTPRNGAAHVAWTAAAANHSPVDHYTVTTSADGATVTATVPGDALAADVGGLANGTGYYFAVVATNAAGDGPPGWSNNAVTPDGTVPAVTLHAIAPVTLSGSVRLSYAATDAGGGVPSVVARYRAAPYGGGFGAFHALGAVTSVPVARGYTYCFSVAATDVARNVSPWTAERCTVVPLDDRALAASPSWTRAAGASFYAGTYTTTVWKGATLTRTGVSGRRLVLVYATATNDATLGVYFNGVLVKQVPAAIAAPASRHVATIDLGAVRSGTVTIRTLTGGRAFVDGLGVSRV